MINRYFSCVDMFRKKRKNFIQREIDYYRLDKYLKTVSPSYDDMQEMIQFVKLLEFSFLYPNEKGLRYATVGKEHLICPAVVSIENNKSMITIFKEKYDIKISLEFKLGLKMIAIQVIDIKTKKSRSEIHFEDGKYAVDESAFEDHLFITIINEITSSISQLLHHYCKHVK